MRRDQDVLKPHNHADFMILASEDQTNYPYWYGRIIGIFHANVVYNGEESTQRSDKPQKMQFLWVWWFGRDLGSRYRDGWRARHLPRIGFVPHDDPGAFGFLDPSLVVRAIHAIPAFSLGRTDLLLPSPSVARLTQDKDEDWAMYYVNM